MGIIINAGSENTGGTLEQAKINAENWLKAIKANICVDDLEMTFVKQYEDGDFLFEFKHLITGKVATLVTHGFTEEECKKFTQYPRVYWEGSSTADPKLEDWLADGYKYKVVYYKQ